MGPDRTSLCRGPETYVPAFFPFFHKSRQDIPLQRAGNKGVHCLVVFLRPDRTSLCRGPETLIERPQFLFGVQTGHPSAEGRKLSSLTIPKKTTVQTGHPSAEGRKPFHILIAIKIMSRQDIPLQGAGNPSNTKKTILSCPDRTSLCRGPETKLVALWLRCAVQTGHPSAGGRKQMNHHHSVSQKISPDRTSLCRGPET